MNCAVVTQTYKLIINPGTFGRRQAIPADDSKTELYDLRSDPAEQRDLAAKYPQIATRLRSAYDRWFEEMKTTRNFEPGLIHLGTDAENPALLSRYQDGTYRQGSSHGWSVKMDGGTYQFRVKRSGGSPAGRIYVTWLGKTDSRPVAENDCATFRFAAGRGMLDVWFQADGAARKKIRDSSAIGDVFVRFNPPDDESCSGSHPPPPDRQRP